MLNFGDALYEAEIRAGALNRAAQATYIPKSSVRRRRSVTATFREAMARLGDLLITVGCELEVRYLTEGHSTPCAG